MKSTTWAGKCVQVRVRIYKGKGECKGEICIYAHTHVFGWINVGTLVHFDDSLASVGRYTKHLRISLRLSRTNSENMNIEVCNISSSYRDFETHRETGRERHVNDGERVRVR